MPSCAQVLILNNYTLTVMLPVAARARLAGTTACDFLRARAGRLCFVPSIERIHPIEHCSGKYNKRDSHPEQKQRALAHRGLLREPESMSAPRARIDGTQMPTYIPARRPSVSSAVKYSDTLSTKLRKEPRSAEVFNMSSRCFIEHALLHQMAQRQGSEEVHVNLHEPRR